MLMDPELFSISQSKEMGIWPPGDANHVKGIYPYIKRLRVDKVKILDVGCTKGEISIYMLEIDQINKIERIDLIVSGGQKEFETILDENIKLESRVRKITNTNEEYDVVMINSNSKNLDKTMRKYYDVLKSNGIFCGNDHGASKVKEALHTFRREDRIGTTMNISNGSWFWYKR